MARRKRKSDFDHTVEGLARLPWLLCLLLAPIAYLGFHQLAQIQPPAAHNVAEMGSTIGVTALKTAGMFLQYLAPMALLLAALMSWSAKRRRTKLLAEAESRAASAPLQQMSWREFEQVVGAHFERLGYSVSFTPDGADGGVDVVARKGSETFLIQCKQWRATQVGVSVVRELFGVMAARGATGGFVISIGPFTADARAFAEGRNIKLVDANTLLRSSVLRPPEAAPVAQPAERSQARACPKCGSAMVRRVAKQGANQGRTFFGCSTYPKCRSTVPAD
ncbi:MAG: restriction endonuclease [Panacagrimonas sp.]